ncbi:integral membrane protein [Fusarium langsethiae]|uniref:Integral membrane protein n=1 Tax=Fusarium langsethiae TaxID=179993 RepID=A0A0N0V5A3_FUSLA|nr:integral membrane protein [Fusarium langsethiae]
MNAAAKQLFELWFLYTVGIVMIAARVFCRTRLVGYGNYDWDDYLVILVGFFWTAAVIFGRIFIQDADGRHTSDLNFEQRKNMNEKDYQEWAYGSKMFLVNLILYVVILWILKFNMLCLYKRVVRGLWTERFVKPLMAQVLLSLVVIILALALTCRPLKQLWQANEIGSTMRPSKHDLSNSDPDSQFEH